jgi:uncharacterized sodium:solute symporter family permease YidK
MPQVEINYVAVLVGAIVSTVLGMLWYSPVLFANQWMKSVGKKKEDAPAMSSAMYLVPIVMALVLSYIMSHFVDYAMADTFTEGMQTGFWAALGFMIPVMGMTSFFDGRKFDYFVINAGYHLVEFALIGGILAVWK